LNLDRPLRVLMAAVALLLLIACANLAGLMLSRAITRRREFGMRLALGAGRARIVRQVLTESTLLAVAGAATGLLVSAWTGKGLLQMAAGAEGLRTIGVAPDSAVFAFTAAALLITSILVGLLPALRVAAFDPNTALRETRAERSAARAARILIPTQVALTAVLAVAAALLLSTFGNFHRVDLGYPPAELLTFRANPGSAGYDADRSRVYFTDLSSRLEGLPSVRSVALSSDSIANLGNTTGVTLHGLADYEERRVGYYRVGPQRIRACACAGASIRRDRPSTAP
jgi:hypothetical protein